MKLANILITLLCLLFTSVAEGQQSDSLVHDIFNFRGQDDRIPVLYQCDKTDGFIFSNTTLDICMSLNYKDIKKKVKYPIKNISILSELDLGMRSGWNPDKKYSSILKLTIDKLGNVTTIETLSHCINSISENELKSILYKTIWKPALKKLKPVTSKLVLEITYENTLCHEETWAKKKFELHRRFPNYRKELMETFVEQGTMWDLEILIPMMEFDNKNSLSLSFDAVEKSCKNHIDSLNTVFMGMQNDLNKFQCQKTYDIVKEWDNAFYLYMDKTLKQKLTHNNK